MHAALCLSAGVELSRSFHFIKPTSHQMKRHYCIEKRRCSYGEAINNSFGEMVVESINGLLLQQTEANIIVDSYRIRGAIIV